MRYPLSVVSEDDTRSAAAALSAISCRQASDAIKVIKTKRTIEKTTAFFDISNCFAGSS